MAMVMIIGHGGWDLSDPPYPSWFGSAFVNASPKLRAAFMLAPTGLDDEWKRQLLTD